MSIEISRLARHATVPFSLRGEDREMEVLKVVGEKYGFSLKEDCRGKERSFDFFCEDEKSRKPICVEIKRIPSSGLEQSKKFENFLKEVFEELEGKVQGGYLIWPSKWRVSDSEEGKAIKQEIQRVILEKKADLEGMRADQNFFKAESLLIKHEGIELLVIKTSTEGSQFRAMSPSISFTNLKNDEELQNIIRHIVKASKQLKGDKRVLIFDVLDLSLDENNVADIF